MLMNFGPLELISVGIVIGVVLAISFVIGTFLIRMRRPPGPR
jgi:hypothetical protein